jgi:hypothetical protein
MATKRKITLLLFNFLFLIGFFTENVIKRFNWFDLVFLVVFVFMFLKYLYVSFIN